MFEIVFDKKALPQLEAHLEQFFKALDVRESSRSTYRKQLAKFISWKQKMAITLPEREDLLAYKEYLKDKRRLSSYTIAGYLTAVRKYFTWLDAMKLYPNVAKQIKSPKRKRGFKKDALTFDQVKLLLQAIELRSLKGLRDFAILNLMIRTGLRTIEISRATREDIAQQNGAHVLWIHGKGRDSKDELVLLTPDTLSPIKEYLKARGKVRDEDPLFISHSKNNFGQRLTTRSISRIVKTRLQAVNLDDDRLTAHSLRHTAITLSLLAGATPQEARTMARHADINTTMIYAHNINRIEQAPERKIEELLNRLALPKDAKS